MTQGNNSDVARLLRQIEDEHESATRAMTGIAEGTARHSFISGHMERMERLRSDLAAQIGSQAATTALCEVMLREEGEISETR